MAWSKMVDMELDDEDKLDSTAPIAMPQKPDYPYGLRICLTTKELAKLGLEPDCDIDDVIDLRAFAVVTGCFRNKIEGGQEECRVELQIQKLAIEQESEENGDD